MTVQQSIRISAPVETVFNYLMDVDNRKFYIPALEDIILLDPLPFKIGSKYIEVANIAGRRLETTYQITNLVDNKCISAKTIKSVFPIQVDLLMKEKNGATILAINLNFQLSGIFKLASGIVRGIVNQQAKDILNKLKRNLESNTKKTNL